MLHGRNIGFIDVGHRAFLEPEGIVDECLYRYGVTLLVSGLPEEPLKPILLAWIGEVGGPPVGA